MMRSLLYVPAHSERFIAKAHLRSADAIILDLEDAVPLSDKLRAREGLALSVGIVGQGGAKVFVRINAGEDSETADAFAATRAGAYGLVVPKVESPERLVALASLLEADTRQTGRAPLPFIAILESPGAVLDARLIAKAPQVIALATGSEDLALSLGAVPSPDVLRFPKLLVHYAAKAEGKLSLGLLRSIADFTDLDAMAAAAAEAKAHGFDGATCIHPDAVAVLNAGFLPSEAEEAWAYRIIAQAERHAGAFTLDGHMVDAPVIARAKAVVALLKRSGA